MDIRHTSGGRVRHVHIQAADVDLRSPPHNQDRTQAGRDHADGARFLRVRTLDRSLRLDQHRSPLYALVRSRRLRRWAGRCGLSRSRNEEVEGVLLLWLCYMNHSMSSRMGSSEIREILRNDTLSLYAGMGNLVIQSKRSSCDGYIGMSRSRDELDQNRTQDRPHTLN